ncbi:hypothetical protein GCM10008927_13240 [Amylibacter ulvae]|uniref:GSCFA domain-containing protein n=1 Tax=Paramylibacter ulvae TaxID=1651968 RepID=A0ABQ3CYV3_9RHOB|nr:GSCFA domain-containing protein [Amylibacter ulvae]GHA49389.1 hypothetical protein GCM10008927_13240 [Amylibacter ulvae]
MTRQSASNRNNQASLIIDGADAWSNSVKNPLRNYPGRVAEGSDATDRLFPLASPTYPTFDDIPDNPKVYVTGTCIARTIENTLLKTNAVLLSRDDGLKRKEGSGNLYGVLTKYNLPAMVNEFIWALSPDQMAHTPDQFIEHRPGEFVDLQLGGTEVRGSVEMLTAHRTLFNNLYAKSRDADVIIIPLAAIEVWYDTQFDVYLNYRPSRKMCIANSGRFELRVLNYQGVMEHLQTLHTLLRKTCKPTAKILYAITPAATPMTYLDADAMHQSVYTKSLQHAAIQDFLATINDPQAGYVPFYEANILQDQRVNFIPLDYRHMTKAIGMRYVGQMMKTLKPNDITFLEVYSIGTANALLQIDEKDKAFDVLNNPKLDGSQNIDLLELKSSLASKLSQTDIALECYRKILQFSPDDPAELLSKLAHSGLKIGALEFVREMIDSFARQFPDETDHLELLNSLYSKRAKDVDPAGRKMITQRMHALWTEQKYDEVIQLLDQHKTLTSQNANLCFQKGLAYSKLHQSEAALENFDHAITHFPDHHLSLERATLLAIQLGMFDRANDYINLHEARFLSRIEPRERMAAQYEKKRNSA